MSIPRALLDLITYGGIFTYPPFKYRLIDSQSPVRVGGYDPHDEAQVQRKGVGSFKPGELHHPGVLSNNGCGGVVCRHRDVCREETELLFCHQTSVRLST